MILDFTLDFCAFFPSFLRSYFRDRKLTDCAAFTIFSDRTHQQKLSDICRTHFPHTIEDGYNPIAGNLIRKLENNAIILGSLVIPF